MNVWTRVHAAGLGWVLAGSLTAAASANPPRPGDKTPLLLEKVEGQDRSPDLLPAQEVKPWTPTESAALSKKALKADSKTDDWRPALKREVDRLMTEVGKDGSLEGLRWVVDSVKTCFDEGLAVARKAPRDLEQVVLLEAAAKGGKAKRILLISESAEFDELHDSVIVCLGDVKAKKIRKSLVFSMGKLQADEVEDAVVYAGSDLSCTRRVKHATLVVQGRIESPEADDVVFINPGERKIERNNETKDAQNPKLPEKK